MAFVGQRASRRVSIYPIKAPCKFSVLVLAVDLGALGGSSRYDRGMEWLNYHHLFYFWTVCQEGSISKAAERLRLAQPTISGQIKTLEEALGESLFRREGRGLALTDVGAVALRYAEDIFAMGKEMQDVIKSRPTGRPIRFAVGIAGTVPKLLARQLISTTWPCRSRYVSIVSRTMQRRCWAVWRPMIWTWCFPTFRQAPRSVCARTITCLVKRVWHFLRRPTSPRKLRGNFLRH